MTNNRSRSLFGLCFVTALAILSGCTFNENLTLSEAMQQDDKIPGEPEYEPILYNDDGLLSDEQRQQTEAELMALNENAQRAGAASQQAGGQSSELEQIADEAQQSAQNP
ncbi:hypothetical protein [Flexibacterium corallicola]|uniref:hypothetical protein n=1 Tax=Flexibacterium corallicola TaxID=3037259 RepID=UPI00286EBA9A|nr:hypothetical protein [Pseudovibrio sp. M1P-2-3]